MREKVILGALALSIGVVLALPPAAAAGSSESGMTQFDVALQIYQVLDVNHGSATEAEAMHALQARDVVPQSWEGHEVVTMAEIGRIMNMMGIEARIADPGDVVEAGSLKRLLEAHRIEIGSVGRAWDEGEMILPSVVLGDRQARRIVSSSDF